MYFVLVLSFLTSNVAFSQPQRVKEGEYIIKMKADSQGRQSAQQQKATTNKALRILSALGKDVEIKRTFSSSSMVQMKSMSQSKIDFLKNHPDVEFIEPNYILSIDPKDAKPFGVPPGGADDYTQSYSAVQVTEAWAIAKPYNDSTTKTVVAIIDTGLDLTHGVFADSNSLWTNTAELNGTSGVDDDGNGYIDDINGWNFVAHSQLPRS